MTATITVARTPTMSRTTRVSINVKPRSVYRSGSATTLDPLNVSPDVAVRTMARLHELRPELDPILLSIPLQLLAYHVALAKGCNIDQPRNLAKSVTVE